ncbi:hypothetical protein, partial [Cryobacterium sp. MDB2-33-2]|uniref:hypothetical protein n=1 Tax=Cryobacterium sp. MDB2-33-2 TaxID=1259179 RepID=UPI001A7EEEE4
PHASPSPRPRPPSRQESHQSSGTSIVRSYTENRIVPHSALVILKGQQIQYLSGYLHLLARRESPTTNQTWVAIHESPSEEIIALFDEHVQLG